MRVTDIAKIVDGRIIGPTDIDVVGIAKIEQAGPGDLSFIANPKYTRFHESTRATALLVDGEFAASRPDITYVVVADPYTAFLRMLSHFAPVIVPPIPGIAPTAVIDTTVLIGTGVHVAPHVVIENDCTIGDAVIIMANTVIESGCVIGDECRIGPNATIGRGTRVGNRTSIHAGTVVGADGFGFAKRADGTWEKIPQTGIVEIGCDVEIGANVTIDRATLGATSIGDGVKIDNLVHVAHNVVIGNNTVIAAQTGISGSTRIGRNNMIAGQVGIVGHVETADAVIIEAQSGVSKSIRKAGRYFGHPAKEHSQALRQEGALRQLPDMLQDLRDVHSRLDRLENEQSVRPPQSSESPND